MTQVTEFREFKAAMSKINTLTQVGLEILFENIDKVMEKTVFQGDTMMACACYADQTTQQAAERLGIDAKAIAGVYDKRSAVWHELHKRSAHVLETQHGFVYADF